MTKRTILCTLALIALATRTDLAADWPQLQKDAGHSGYTDDQPNPPFKLKWLRDLNEPVFPAHQPIVAGGKVFFGTSWGNVYALDRETANTVWTYKTGAPIFGATAYTDGVLYVNSMDHFCHAVEANSGKEKWKYETGWGIWAGPVLAEGMVFVAGRDGLVYALDAAKGTEVWRSEVPSLVMNTPAYSNGTLYVAVGDMRVYAMDTKDGKQKWRSEQLHGMAFRDYWVTASKNRVFLTAQLVTNSHTVSHAIQSAVMDKFRAAQAGSEVLDEKPVFAMLTEWYDRNPSTRTYYALDAKDGKERFTPPVIGVHGGGCVPPLPAISPDGWAYIPYANVTLGASGQTFLGRINVETGEMDPLLKGWFAAPPASGYWVKGKAPAPGRNFNGASDWSGGFGVSDHSWGVSIGGDWIYTVRDAGWVPDPKTSLSMFNVKTGTDTRVTNSIRDQGLFRKGHYNGTCHATCSPVVISGGDLFYKSIRNVIYAFEGTSAKSNVN